MRHWFILSAIGRDKPGLVADLAGLLYEVDANLEDSRMTILGSEFAVILLGSSAESEAFEQIARAAKRLERQHGLVVEIRRLEAGARPPVPGPGTQLFRVTAVGEDKAGIVANICRVLAERDANITELTTRSLSGPGGSPHYELKIVVEVLESRDTRELRDALEAEADRLIIDVAILPV